jgi:hypothetical protein
MYRAGIVLLLLGTDLSKSGISPSTIKKIAPLVTVRHGAAPTKNATTSAPSSQPASSTPRQPSPRVFRQDIRSLSFPGQPWIRNGLGEPGLGRLPL